ncbi:MAG TPA: biopolymer transporter ExbD [Polyangiaceae bacterium]|nr:biopolymer transporter ExbD [Polyangiaceae bacterium]
MGMALGGGDKKGRSTPAINVTPLVDVVLVVLIIFMITVTMVTKTFWLNLPKAEKDEPPPPPSDNKPLVMTVDKDGTIRANQTVLSKADVQTRVVRMLAAKNQKVLYFDAHDQAPYGRAMEAMDLARAGGVKSIAMLTEPVMK